MSNLVEFILSSKYNKFQLPFVKWLIKIVPAEIDIEVTDEGEMTYKDEATYDYFYDLVQQLKGDGLSRSDILTKLDREFKQYNIKFTSLPKVIYELYGE